MTASAIAAVPCFFDQNLLSTRDPQTANVAHSAWVANLEMGVHATIQLAQNLKEEMKGGAPSKETMHALYQRVLTLSTSHEPHWSNPSFTDAISKPLSDARKTTESWYLGCIEPEKSATKSTQVCPTPLAVQELINDLKSLVAVDDDGNSVIDLAATAKPFIDRYNVACKPAQVFTTPAELFQPGAPLAWMAGK